MFSNPKNWRNELANKTKGGRAVGNWYVLTDKGDDGRRSCIVAYFSTEAERRAFKIAMLKACASRFRVEHYDGAQSSHDTVGDAIDAVTERYPGAQIGGHDGDLFDGGASLVWARGQTVYDASRSVAKIVRVAQ